MKTKFLTRMFGLVLSAAVAFSSVPVSATEAVDTNPAESSATEELKAEEPEEEVEDVFMFDWKSATIEEINEVVSYASDADLGVWLKSMNKEDYEKLLSMDTYLHSMTEVTDYAVDEDGNMTADEGSIKTMEYYEYALLQVPKNNQLTFNKKEGFYSLKFVYGGITYTYKMSITKIKTGVSAAKAQEVTLALTQDKGAPAALEFTSTAGKADKTRYLKQKVGDDESNYSFLNLGFNFTKPAGYTLTYTTNKQYPGTQVYYHDDGKYETKQRKFKGSSNTARERYNLVSCMNLRDAGVTMTTAKGTKQDAQNSYFKFDFKPITYSVNYNGNGATGGSTANQSCAYGTSYYPQPNGFVRSYGINYNANGGIATKTNENVSYTFAGWGFNTNTVANYPVNKAFSNLTTANGGVINAYAIWNPAPTSLPTATRTGYTFAGWKNSADNKVYAGGSTYTPVVASTMTAQWTPNTYTIRLEGNNDMSYSDIKATYGKAVTLPTPEREGYTFLGWSGGSGVYTGSVQNLTAENNATVSLSALWEGRTDVPYKIIYSLYDAGIEDYVEKEVLEMTGTVGDSVTAAVKYFEGYLSPAAETKQIKADGTTVFEYKYRLDQKDTVTYRVEHYLQDRDDNRVYVLDEENSAHYQIEEGSTVTPDVITTYEGYNVPNPQTVTITNDGTIIKYYYNLSAADRILGEMNSGDSGDNGGSSNKNNHISEEPGGNKADINNFKYGDIKYYTDKYGNVYEIFVNSDGTLTVRAINTAGSSKTDLTVSSTITVNGVKYQISEIAANAFKNNKKIKTVKIGNSITKIGKSAFEGCTKLKKVTFGTSLSEIGSRAFYGCTSLTTVKTNKALTKIGSKAFYNCKKLKSYTIGKYVTEIGSQAFGNCKKLKKITIAESVEIVRDKAFYGCKSLKSVNIKTTKLLKVGKAAFKKCKKNITFTVPKKKEKKYKSMLKGKY